jgi:hypothetical protein
MPPGPPGPPAGAFGCFGYVGLDFRWGFNWGNRGFASAPVLDAAIEESFWLLIVVTAVVALIFMVLTW